MEFRKKSCEINFFFRNTLFKKEKVGIVLIEKFLKKFQIFKFQQLTYFFLNLPQHFYKKLNHNFPSSKHNLNNTWERRRLFSNLFHDLFFSSFYFRKKENIGKSPIKKNNFFYNIRNFYLFIFLPKGLFLRPEFYQLFFEKTLQNYFKRKKKNLLNDKLGCFFYKFNFLDSPGKFDVPLDFSIFSSIFDSFIFYFKKYSHRFCMKKIYCSVYSCLLLEILTNKNFLLFTTKKTFQDSVLIKKKHFSRNKIKWFKLIYKQISPENIKRIRKDDKTEKRKNLFPYEIDFIQTYNTRLFYIFSRKTFQKFFLNCPKINSNFTTTTKIYFKNFKKNEFSGSKNPLFLSIISEGARRGIDFLIKDLEFFMKFFLSTELSSSNDEFFPIQNENFNFVVFRFFSFFKNVYWILICIYFFGLRKISKKTTSKAFENLFSYYLNLLPSKQLSRQSIERLTTKKMSKKVSKANSPLICKKCTLELFCSDIGGSFKEKKNGWELEKNFEKLFKFLPFKISLLIQARNYFLSFYNSIFEKFFQKEISNFLTDKI